MDKGPHEIKEFGPALRSCMTEVLTNDGHEARVELNHTLDISNWTRPNTQVDLVVSGSQGPELVAELKAWDIGHQLFDLAKVCCLLESGIAAGFLVCIAYRSGDFDRKPGGELFPAEVGESREHDFRKLIDAHLEEWRCHVGKGTPEPTAVPTAISTTAVAAGVELEAYPEHEVRAIDVSIIDDSLIELIDGFPTPDG